MSPEREQELFRTLRSITTKLSALQNTIDFVAPEKDEILNTSKVVELTGFSLRKVRQLISDGEIPYTRKENRIKFSRNAIIKWLNSL